MRIQSSHNSPPLITLWIRLCLIWRDIHHDSLNSDLMLPVFDRLIHRFKSFQTIMLELQSCSEPQSFLLLLRLLVCAGQHGMVVDSWYLLVKSYGFVSNTFASNLLVDFPFRIDQPLAALAVFNVIFLHQDDHKASIFGP
jgi:hypothetical protein